MEMNENDTENRKGTCTVHGTNHNSYNVEGETRYCSRYEGVKKMSKQEGTLSKE